VGAKGKAILYHVGMVVDRGNGNAFFVRQGIKMARMASKGDIVGRGWYWGYIWGIFY